jgi:hypothetical protein
VDELELLVVWAGDGHLVVRIIGLRKEKGGRFADRPGILPLAAFG